MSARPKNPTARDPRRRGNDIPQQPRRQQSPHSESRTAVAESRDRPAAVQLPMAEHGPLSAMDGARSLRAGCYLIRYTPAPLSQPSIHYDGTLRVERSGANVIASGDLYLHKLSIWPVDQTRMRGGRPSLLDDADLEPSPSAGVPIFPRAQYRYYLRVTQILEGTTTSDSFTLGFERHRFDHATRNWTNEGTFTAQLRWSAAPAGFPSAADFLSGPVKNPQGDDAGLMSAGWVSSWLRRAVLEVDRVAVSEVPLENGLGEGWREVFAKVGWDMTVIESDSNLTEPSGESWSNAECHSKMLEKRDSADLDSQWRFHLLCVRQLDATPRGIMYDSSAGDSNNIPREGVAISSHWIMPNSPEWGRVQGRRFGATPSVYFRTAVHEAGHAMGLYHNTVDNGFMNTTDVISASAVPPVEFPDNIKWAHANDDQKRLRHLPDIHVRPGGTPFGTDFEVTPISPDDLIEDAAGLVLEVAPLLPAIPIGAPVRINYTLKNVTGQTLPSPADLSLKGGFVSGAVIDPSGVRRGFTPLLMCVDGEDLRHLDPGESISESVTLLRGQEGSLFPMGGVYQAVVEISWHMDGTEFRTSGRTTVMITPPEDAEHAEAALKVISTPDALLTLVLGGDHLTEGVAAIQAGLSCRVLRPHFALVEAKRLAEKFHSRPADPAAAMEIIDESTVMSAPEIRRAAGICKLEPKDAPRGGNSLRKILAQKVRDVKADVATARLVDEI